MKGAAERTEPQRPVAPSTFRRLVDVAVLSVCFLLLVRQWGIEPYEVPTGSMAPALAGHHRAKDCPRCGYRVAVGRHEQDKDAGPAPFRCYRGASCPNCGFTPLDLHTAPIWSGDRVLVNRSVFVLRRPRRWEIIVFRLLGLVFVKRLVGLPGELIEIVEGDLRVDGELQRKTLDEVKALRVPVFDNAFQPRGGDWRERWEVPTGQTGPHPLAGTELRLDGSGSRDRYQLVAYRNFQLDTRKCPSLTDEYGYNGGDHRPRVAVHDFMMEGVLEVSGGEGWVLLAITDGKDRLVAEIPVGSKNQTARLSEAANWPAGKRTDFWPGRGASPPLTTAQDVQLEKGKSYRVELALVDRRLTLAIDGRTALTHNLPPSGKRAGVARPVVLGAKGVRAVVRNFRLFRDIHYTHAGINGLPGKGVHLGSDQYFVLGDNSPNSHDSRFWPDGGVVPGANVLGKPFVVHMPGRLLGTGGGAAGAVQGTDWSRVRWLP